MNLGLDYDDTYTRDPETWDKAIKVFREAGHKVYLVTWRYADEMTPEIYKIDVDGFFPTGRCAKFGFMYAKGVRIDVVIDDNPRSWTQGM